MLGLFRDFGPMGLMVAYVIWDKSRIGAKWLSHEERRLKVDEARIETDKEMVLALQALTFRITGSPKP